MISIIICSRDSQMLDKVSVNISSTIGVDHEIIGYDNSLKGTGICKVYNECAEKAKYEFLCFVHEDVEFLSSNWGHSLINKANEAECGVIGLAGGLLRSGRPVSWGDTGKKYSRYNFFQRDNGIDNHHYYNPYKTPFSEVLVMDGLFLFCKKNIWEEFQFDEVTFPKFHLYDQDFTFNVATKYRNYVSNELRMTHFSHGSFGKTWHDELLKFLSKWQDQLPKSIIEHTEKDWKKINSRDLYVYIRRYLIKNNLDKCLIDEKMKEFRKLYPFDLRILKLWVKRLVRPYRNYDFIEK